MRRASWGSGLTVVSVEDIESVGEEACVGRGERGSTRGRGDLRFSSS